MRIALGAGDRAVMFEVDERAAKSVKVPPERRGEGTADAPRRSAVERPAGVAEPNSHAVHSLIHRQHRSVRGEEQHALRCGGVELRQLPEPTKHREQRAARESCQMAMAAEHRRPGDERFNPKLY